jgi:hypothetical protein
MFYNISILIKLIVSPGRGEELTSGEGRGTTGSTFKEDDSAAP